jgi:hypothetical protein
LACIKKVLTKSVQYLPKLLINNGLIPTIQMGESFKYLGRFFDFDMSDHDHKSELMSLIDELMSDIDHKYTSTPKKQTSSIQPLRSIQNILASHCCTPVENLGNRNNRFCD